MHLRSHKDWTYTHLSLKNKNANKPLMPMKYDLKIKSCLRSYEFYGTMSLDNMGSMEATVLQLKCIPKQYSDVEIYEMCGTYF